MRRFAYLAGLSSMLILATCEALTGPETAGLESSALDNAGKKACIQIDPIEPGLLIVIVDEGESCPFGYEEYDG